MSEELYLNQELCGKAVIAIAKSMMYYAETGAENYPEVGAKLNEAMNLIANELTPRNQESFAKWLENKTKEHMEKYGAE